MKTKENAFIKIQSEKKTSRELEHNNDGRLRLDATEEHVRWYSWAKIYQDKRQDEATTIHKLTLIQKKDL